MSEWYTCALADAPLQIIDGDRGKNYPSQDEFRGEGHCLFLSTKNVRIDGFDLSDCQFISKERDELLRKGKLEKYDLVLTTRGTVGNIGFFNDSIDFENIRINSGMVIIRPDKTKLIPSFNYYLFRKLQGDFSTFVSGSAQPQLPIRDLNAMEVSLPPLKEQKSIASILGGIDNKIGLLRRQNKILEAMAETLFRQRFVEDKMYERARIGDVLHTVLGGTPSTGKDEYWNGDIPWINSGEVNNFRILSSTKYITQLGLNKSNAKLLPKGTTVLAITGATLGQVSLLEIDTCANQSVVGIIPNERFPRELVYLWVKANIGEIVLNETGGAQPHINKNDINNTEIICLDADGLKLIECEIKPIFEKITKNVFQIETLKKLRDVLLPKLMSGEVRIA